MIFMAVIAVMLLTVVVPAFAQAAQEPLQGWVAYVAKTASAVLPVLIPLVVVLIRNGLTMLPPWLLPAVSVLVGALLDVLTAWLSNGAPSSWGVLSGLAATGLHQMKRQLYDKQN